MGARRGYRAPPWVYAFGFMVSGTLLGIFYLPLVEYQRVFWTATIILFVGGDSVTTGLLGRFDLEEQWGYTRLVCGAEPSLLCSFGTRAVVVGVGYAFHLVVFQFGVGVESDSIVLTALVIPLILALGGFAATVINAYAFVHARQTVSVG